MGPLMCNPLLNKMMDVDSKKSNLEKEKPFRRAERPGMMMLSVDGTERPMSVKDVMTVDVLEMVLVMAPLQALGTQGWVQDWNLTLGEPGEEMREALDSRQFPH
jgi:hypothetical protein